MSKLQHHKSSQNLAQYRVLVDDDEGFFFQLRELDEILHAGKNAFLIAGSEFLEPTTEVLVEIIDANGDTIFNQPIRNYAEGRSRLVSVEVYETTPAGPATLTILGGLRNLKNGDPVPDQWKGVYNVKYQTRLTVDPRRINDTKIRVYDEPELVVQEVLSPFRKAITGSLRQQTGSVIFGIKEGAVGQTLIHTINPSSSVPNIYTVFLSGSYGPYVSKSFLDGSFTASISQSDFSGTFTSSIVALFNSQAFQVDPGLKNVSGTRYLDFASTNFTISFQDDTTFEQTTLNRSYADVQLRKLTTFAGDISRVRVYVRSLDQHDETFQPMTDQVIMPQEITQTQSVLLGPAVSIGDFTSQDVVDEFWTSGSINTSSIPPYIPASVVLGLPFALQQDTAYLFDSMYAPYLYLRTSRVQVGPTAYFGTSGSLPFFKDLEYVFSTDVLCIKDTIYGDFDALMEVYLTGSAFPNTGPTSSFGVKIASFAAPKGQTRLLKRDNQVNFIPHVEGSGSLRFVLYGGEWHIANTSIKSAVETGFNPDIAELVVPMLGRRFEHLEFKAQLFDPNNNLFPQEIFSEQVFFDGGNLLLRGTDHRVEGTLTVAPSGSGVTLSSTGFFDTDGTPHAGSAMFIGEGRFFHSGTAFLVASDTDNSPFISIQNKLKGYVDPADNTFKLIFLGDLLVGSGSVFTSILSLLPSDTSEKYFHRARGVNAEFFDIEGKKAVTAGNVDASNISSFSSSLQVGRLGRYTRGTIQRTVPDTSPLIVSGLTSSFDPMSASFVTSSISASGTITIPSGTMFWNETMYGNINVGLDELLLPTGSAYRMSYELIVDTSWVGYKSGSGVGSTFLPVLDGTRVRQTVATRNGILVTSASSYSPDPFLTYPIHVPQNRPDGYNTLYVVVELDVFTQIVPTS